MKNYWWQFLCLSLVVIMSANCGSDDKNQNATDLANGESVNDLQQLFDAHPEFSKATLRDIKESALQNDDDIRSLAAPTEHAAKLHLLVKGNTEENAKPAKANTPLDSTTAADAQRLIDKILDDFDFAAFYSASMKYAGVMLNEMAEQMKQFESMAKDLEDMHGGKKPGLPSPNDEFNFPTEPMPNDVFAMSSVPKFGETSSSPKNGAGLPTCEELMNDPSMQAVSNAIQKAINASKQSIKKSLSGCAEVLGSRFVECVELFNHSVQLMNKHASCEVKSMKELESAIEKDLGASLKDHDAKLSACMNQDFSRCGFQANEMPQAEINNDGDTHARKRH